MKYEAKKLIRKISDKLLLISRITYRLYERAKNIRIITKKKLHIVICGCSRSGTTLLYSLLHISSKHDDVYIPETEISAVRLSYPGISQNLIISKRPLDVFDIEFINHHALNSANLIYLVQTRDPRDLVTSFHGSVPNQYFQSVDYQFFVCGKIKSLGYPGVMSSLKACTKLLASYPEKALSLRYEQLVSDPETIRNVISVITGNAFNSFSLDSTSSVPRELQSPLNGIRPVSRTNSGRWQKDKDSLRQILRLHELFPEFSSLIQEAGYLPTDHFIDMANIDTSDLFRKPGTIIAFHTQDELYTAEALRLEKSIRKLGLSYEIRQYTPSDSWVVNCSLKPNLILEARKRLRGDLLYVDADAFLHSNPWPYLSQFDCDVAANVLLDGQLASGTILIRDTVGAFRCLEMWVESQSKDRRRWDQEVLQDLVEKEDSSSSKAFIFCRLPPSMAWIYDYPYKYFYQGCIVEHLQASRIANSSSGSDVDQKRLDRIMELESLI
jgi:hypothetical protein